MKEHMADWRIHALAFVLTVIAEFIGTKKFSFGPLSFSLFPMLYVLILGAILGIVKLIPQKMMTEASPYIGISVMMLTAKIASTIGPNLAAAHALFLQVDHLEFYAALLEIALRLFGIKALARAKDLDIHLLSSCRFPAVLLYHTANRLHRHNLRQNGQCFPQGGVCMNAFVDPELCIGCTQCAGLCPAVFRMEGVLAVAEPGPIPPEEVPQAVTAAQSCPVSAIRIEE